MPNKHLIDPFKRNPGDFKFFLFLFSAESSELRGWCVRLLLCSEWGCREVGIFCNCSEHGIVPCFGDARDGAHCCNSCDRLDRSCLRSHSPRSLPCRQLFGTIQDHHHLLLHLRCGQILPWEDSICYFYFYCLRFMLQARPRGFFFFFFFHTQGDKST